MQLSESKILFWTPRVLTILFALFISLFALDVFNENQGFWQTTAALLMHLIPTFLILIVLIVSWRREWIATIMYVALALLYIILMWGRFPVATYLLISGPLVLIGLLFLFNWYQRIHLQENPGFRP